MGRWGEMHPVKAWIIAAGVVVAALGYECMPHGQSLIPDNFSSSFARLADAGTFAPFGVKMMVAGACIVIVGLLTLLKE